MGGKHYLLVESTEATPFATIYWQKLCSLTLENKIFGSTVFELPTALTLGLVNQGVKTISQKGVKGSKNYGEPPKAKTKSILCSMETRSRGWTKVKRQ